MLPAARTAFRILTFQASTEELRGLNSAHLVLGLICSWIVGMGRWWEDPRANLWQHLGVGSLAYVFVLAAFLWLLLWPLRPAFWSYRNLLTFIALTSIPGILYAIPVRHGLGLEPGQMVRLWLLAIVSGWRVALLVFYLGRAAGFRGFRRFLASFFPLMLIVVALTMLNLERVVFNIMGGIAPDDRSVNDVAYEVLMTITLLSFYVFVPFAVIYLIISGTTLFEIIRERRCSTPHASEKPHTSEAHSNAPNPMRKMAD